MSKRFTLLLAMIAPVLLTAQAPISRPLEPPQTTTVEGLTAVAPAAPAPDIGPGATMFTAEYLKDMAERERVWSRCALPGGVASFVYNRALAALEATQAAEQVRRDMASGQASQEDVDRAELARQRAVRFYLGDFETKDKAQPGYITHIPDITMVELDGEFLVDNGRTVFVMKGVIRNDKAGKVKIPDLAITLMDRQGFVLLDRAIEPTVKHLNAGQTTRIAYRLPAAPDSAAKFRITYAPKEGFAKVYPCGLSPRASLLGYHERDVRKIISDSRAMGKALATSDANGGGGSLEAFAKRGIAQSAPRLGGRPLKYGPPAFAGKR